MRRIRRAGWLLPRLRFEFMGRWVEDRFLLRDNAGLNKRQITPSKIGVRMAGKHRSLHKIGG